MPQTISSRTTPTAALTASKIHRIDMDEELKLNQVKQQISSLIHTLEECKALQLELEGSVYHYKALLAPIAQLPVEVLCMIFVNYVRDRHDRSARVLALVCQSWKEIAYDTAELWREIVLVPGNKDYPPWEAALHYPSRAKGLSLGIRIDLVKAKTAKECRLLSLAFFHVLKQYHWRTLKIECYLATIPIQYFFPFIRFLSDPKARGLSSFLLQLPTHGPIHLEDDEWDAVEDGFEAAQSLKELSIPNQLLWSSHPVFSRLQRLEFQGWYEDQDLASVGHFLQHCQCLQVLDMLCTSFSSEERPVEPFVLPNLKTLILDAVDPLDDLFAKMIMPRLEDLRIADTRHKKDKDIKNALQNLITQAPACNSIKSLAMTGLPCGPMILNRLLRSLRALEHLHIDCRLKPLDKVLEALARPATERRPWLCPKLRFLQFSNCDYFVPPSTVNLEPLILSRVRDFQKASRGSRKTQNLASPMQLKSVICNGEEKINAVLGEGWMEEHTG